jgi:hypothetical protein
MSTVVHSIAGHPRLRISRLVQLLVARQQLAALDELRTHLPLDDPDRHDLDRVDTACCRMRITAPDPEAVTAQRRAALLRAAQTQGGRWKTGRTVRLYAHLGYGPVSPSAASRDLQRLTQAGVLKRHDKKGVTYYTCREACMPEQTSRRDYLIAAIRAAGRPVTTRSAERLLAESPWPTTGRNTARKDLRALAAQGHLTPVSEDGRTIYIPKDHG